jgi:hypothetical protein
MVVEGVYAEEEDNVDQPASNWHLVRLEEEWGARSVELSRQADDGDKDELDECEEHT